MRHILTHRSGWLPSTLSALSLIVVLVGSLPYISAQAIDSDKIDFSKEPIWDDLKTCVQCILSDCYNNFAYEEGCETDACMCRASTLGSSIPVVKERVLSECSNYDDASTAVSVLTAHCSKKGYTEIVQPTVIETTGAFTVTVAAATITVVETQVVPSGLDISSSKTKTGAIETEETITSVLSSSQIAETLEGQPIDTTTSTPYVTTEAPSNHGSSLSSDGTSQTEAASSQSSTQSSTGTSNSASATGSENKDSGNGKLKVGEIIGIVLGLLSLVVGVISVYVMKKQNRNTSSYELPTIMHK
ncbi:Fc.00g046600.m01.CDS01 [Cosmosporella sp. VM-42]